MARTRTQRARTPDKFTREDLIYLAGCFECHMNGFKSVGDGPIYNIRWNEHLNWTEAMANTYGGTAEPFVAKSGTNFRAWYMPRERRLELITLMEQAGVCRGTESMEFDGFRGKLEKTIAKSATAGGQRDKREVERQEKLAEMRRSDREGREEF